MKDSERILGIGVIGLGVGEQLARAFHAHPHCEVRSLYDFDSERSRMLAAMLPGCAVAERFEEMLTNPRIDVLTIATFDDAHYKQVLAALKAGKHVFVEKPVCRTIEELADIKAEWLTQGRRLKLFSNLVLRTAPLYIWLRKQIRLGELGQIYAFDGDYLYGRLHKITEGWRKDISDYSVMEGGGIHLLDLMMWLNGERPISVTASGNHICTSGTAFRYNDFVAATFEFESGLIARITANFGCVHRHHHMMRVFGTQATFLYDDAGARLNYSRDSVLPAEQLAHAPLPAHKGDLVLEFVSAILNNAEESDQTQMFFDSISACIAADKAATTGKKERIEYL